MPLQTLFTIMQQAVRKCPKIKLECLDKPLPWLLNSGSMVGLVSLRHFEQHIKMALDPYNGPQKFAHNLFN